MKTILLGLMALSLVIVVSLAGGRILERNRLAAERQALREALNRARISADSCKNSLAWEQREFMRFDQRVDSLRGVVEGYEDPAQGGGVPEADYEAYLETFDLYNSSVEDWKARADSLQAKEARCRASVEAHNQLADSVRTLIGEAGEGPDTLNQA